MRSSIFFAAATAGYVAAQDTGSIADAATSIISSAADGAEPTGSEVAAVSSWALDNPSQASQFIASYASESPEAASSYLQEFYSTADPTASSQVASAASGFFGPVTAAGTGSGPMATAGNGTAIPGVSSAAQNASSVAESSYLSSLSAAGSTVS